MIKLKDAAENALLITLADTITEDLPMRIRAACKALEKVLGNTIIELVPAYTTILLYHHPHPDIQSIVTTALQTTHHHNISPKTITLPVYYHHSVAPDLNSLAAKHKLSIKEIITIHSAVSYQVYAVGFAPAFAYLGMVDSRIVTPRLNSPRALVPAGSVGIANMQTAVYPVAGPAGWNIVGRTPVNLSLDNLDNIQKFSIGDRVKFEPIDKEDFLILGGKL